MRGIVFTIPPFRVFMLQGWGITLADMLDDPRLSDMLGLVDLE